MKTHTLRQATVATSCIVALLSIAGSAGAQTPFACTGEAFIIQDLNAQLTQIDQTTDPFTFINIGGPTGREINNLAFNRADGLVYGVELTSAPNGNSGIVQIDNTGTVFTLGSPGGLPTTLRFDAGDINPDGDTMYINRSGVGTLYRVSLPGLAVVSVGISGATGTVFDWAYNPADGMLYGGDLTGAGGFGQLAQLNPLTGVRSDSAVNGCMPVTADCNATNLPAGTSFGGAWFNAAGRLFLYQNSGIIFEIDLAGPTIVSTQSGPGSTRNDGAACIQDVIGVAKHMTSGMAGFPDPIAIDYTFENISTTESLFNLSAEDDLTAVFGVRGTSGDCSAPVPAGADWFFNSISSSPASFANPGYDGDTDIELINQMPVQTFAPLQSATIDVSITLCNQENATPPNPPGTGGPPYLFFNSVLFTGENAAGTTFGDVSHDDGTNNPDPDPDMNGSPDERDPAQVPVELMEFSID